MEVGHKPVLLFLPLCFSIALTVLKLLLSPSYDLWELSCCPLFVYALLNAIIFAILLDNCYRLSKQELGDNLPVVFFSYETYEEKRAEVSSEEVSNGYNGDAAESDGDKIDESKGEYFGSDVDDDDNGSVEERDPEFERRIEAFIAKVVEGWRQECIQGNKIARNQMVEK